MKLWIALGVGLTYAGYRLSRSVLRVKPVEVDPELIREIEEAMALPIGHVAAVTEDGRILVHLNEDGMDLLALGFLTAEDPR